MSALFPRRKTRHPTEKWQDKEEKAPRLCGDKRRVAKIAQARVGHATGLPPAVNIINGKGRVDLLLPAQPRQSIGVAVIQDVVHIQPYPQTVFLHSFSFLRDCGKISFLQYTITPGQMQAAERLFGVLVQFGWAVGLLLGGIRSAGVDALADRETIITKRPGHRMVSGAFGRKTKAKNYRNSDFSQSTNLSPKDFLGGSLTVLVVASSLSDFAS